MKAFCTLALVSATAAGCVTVDPRARFPAVEQTVAQRTQQRVHWHTGTPADDAVRVQVDRLLAQDLTADAAAQIALLNNRHLQATYEDLGVAQADLVQAGLLRNPVFDGSIHFFEANSHSPKLDLGIAFNFLDLFFVAAVVHIVIGLRLAVEARNAHLASTVEALTAKEEEIARQNEELQSQTEELERQSEELRIANDDLAAREKTLEHLLALSRSLINELTRGQVLQHVCEALGFLMGSRAAASAIVERENGNVRISCHHGFGPDGLAEKRVLER